MPGSRGFQDLAVGCVGRAGKQALVAPGVFLWLSRSARLGAWSPRLSRQRAWVTGISPVPRPLPSAGSAIGYSAELGGRWFPHRLGNGLCRIPVSHSQKLVNQIIWSVKFLVRKGFKEALWSVSLWKMRKGECLAVGFVTTAVSALSQWKGKQAFGVGSSFTEL